MSKTRAQYTQKPKMTLVNGCGAVPGMSYRKAGKMAGRQLWREIVSAARSLLGR